LISGAGLAGGGALGMTADHISVCRATRDSGCRERFASLWWRPRIEPEGTAMTLRTWLRPAIPAFATVLLAATAITPAARAQTAPVSAEQAKVVEGNIRAWIAGQIGAAVDVSTLPLRVVAETDSYQLEVPFGGLIADGAVHMDDGKVTLRVKQLDDHRWSIEDFRLPSPWTFSVDKSLQDASKEGFSGLTIKIGDQDTHGVLDTSLATTSTVDTKIQGYTVVVQGKQGPQTTRVDGLTSHMAWQPTADGLLTMTGQSNLDGYKAATVLPDGQKLAIDIAHMRASLTAKGVAMADMGTMIHSVAQLIASAKAIQASGAPKPDGIPDADKATVKALVKALAGLMGSLTTDTSYEDVKVDVGGQAGSLHKLSIGFDMAAPKGRADIAWRIGLEGLESPMIPPGVYRDYLPREVKLTPHIGGIPKAALLDLVLKSIDDPDAADNFMPMATALLEKGPLVLGVKDISLDLGPAKLTGGGAVKVTSVADYSGAGEFRVTGLDALIQRVNATPELKQAGPGLIFVKGIGHQDGKVTVWKIRYEGNKLFINDTDMSAMIPGGK
jgi:hypothetical protein